MSLPEGKEAVDTYFNDYLDQEEHLPKKLRHRLVIGKNGKLTIAQINWVEGCATKMSRSKLGNAVGLGKLCSSVGIRDANILRVLLACRDLGVDKKKIQKLMDHFNRYHQNSPVSWKDLF